MQEIERQVRREARAMTRREIITKAIAKRLRLLESNRAKCDEFVGGWSITGWRQ
jgi:hypothetical protein